MNLRRILILIFTLFAGTNIAFGADKKRVLKLAAVDLGPYVSESTESHGFLYQIIEQVFNAAGYPVELEFYPALRALELVASGDRDVLIPAFIDKQPDPNLIYSSAIYESQITKIKLKSFDGQKSRKAVARDSFFQSGQDLPNETTYTETERTSQLIDMLNGNRVDLIVADQLVAAEILMRKRPHLIRNIEFLKPPLQTRSVRVAFSKKIRDHRILAQDFNKVLEEMKKSKAYDEILARFGLEERHPPNKAGEAVLTIGLPNNTPMKDLEDLKTQFEKANPKTRIEFRFLTETVLRRRAIVGMILDDGYFDIITVGPADLAFFARNKWIQAIKPLDARYDTGDILPNIRDSVTFEGQMFGLPFYGETTMTYYRKDLFAQKSLTMPANPKYSEIRAFAEKLHDPGKGIYGICLRGRKGWKMGIIGNMVHSFGGQYFDSKWQPQFTNPKFKEAVGFYMNLVNDFGPPDVSSKNYEDNLNLFAEGHCAIWIDATAAASTLFDPNLSRVSDKTAIASTPIAEYIEGSQWLWTWILSISNASKHKAAALKFVQWATSKEYIALVAKTKGWLAVPPGTRASTYNASYALKAPFSPFVYASLQKFKPLSDRFPDTPYRNTRYADIPEWMPMMANLDSHLSDILNNKESLDSGLGAAQKDAWQMLYQAGYFKEKAR